MIKKFALSFLFCLALLRGTAQEDNHASIKLFLDPFRMYVQNVSDDAQRSLLRTRLYDKLTQIINRTSVVEIGYSTFLVVPTLDLLSSEVSETGVTKVHLVECDLQLSVLRTALRTGGSGEASFNSTSKTLRGSGSTKSEALFNALSSLSSSDKEIQAFLMTTKEKINSYYQVNCGEVMKQANQYLGLANYQGAIALFWSIPLNAPCYDDAIEAAQGVYTKYVIDECKKNLVKLKAYVALAQTNSKYYDSAMHVMTNLSPSSDKCYVEAFNEIGKIEARLDETQKQNWQLIRQIVGNEGEVKKARYKAMGRVAKNYQPPPSTNNVIVIKP